MNCICKYMGILAMVGLTPAAMAVPFTADFETDQSANFTEAINTGTPVDASVDWTYDSATHTQLNGPAITIPAAPGTTGVTQNVVRLNANISDATYAGDAASIYPNVTGLSSSWFMTVDVWQNYNGPATGGSGSTEMFIIGATNSTGIKPHAITSPALTGAGFYFGMTSEGGNIIDYKFYSGSTTIGANNAAASWMGGTSGGFSSNSDAAWTAFFTQPTFETLGSPGKAWVTFQLAVDGNTAILKAKRPGDSDYTTIAVASGAVPAGSVNPFVGYSDTNAGLPSTPAWTGDQFTLIDNMVVDNAPSAVKDWTLY